MNRSDLPVIRMHAKPKGLRFKAPDSAMARWDRSLELKAKASEIALTGITGLDYTFDSVREQLQSIGKGPIRLILNSPGGDPFEGIAIYNALLEHPGRLTVSVFGIAASAASIVAMAGDRIEMGEASFLMIHRSSGMVMGTSADMRQLAVLLNEIDNVAADLYARRSGQTMADVIKMMDAETYMTAKEAVRLGFADVSIADPNAKKSPSASIRSNLPALVTPSLLAASGTQQALGVRMSLSAGVTAYSKGNSMNTLQSQVAELETQRRAKMERHGEIAMLFQKSPQDVTDEVRAEFDGIDSELVAIEDSLRSKKFEMRMAGAAQPIQLHQHTGSIVRGAPYLNLKSDPDDKFPGQAFTRKVIAMALAHNHHVSPAEVAQRRWGKTNPQLVEVIRMAAIPGAGSDSGEWGAELVTADNRYTGDFIEYLYAMTVFDRLPLREVPAHVTVKGTDGAATGYWVGQSKAIPATQGSASTVALTPLKVAALAVASNEILADSSPAAEAWIRDLLANALAQRVDQTFLSASAASSGVSPAGILNGISALSTAGTSADNIRTDIEVLLSQFIAAHHVSGLIFVTSPGLALALQLMRNSLGQYEFPGVNLSTGGVLEGYRLIAGDNVGSGDFILLDPKEIWRIGDSGLQVSISREATIEQDSGPTGATDVPTGMTTTNMTSMFQEESTAIKIVRRINYQKRRATAVAYIGDAGYGGVAS